MVGAGVIGGYFGGRLLEAGLRIRSRRGAATLSAPPVVQAAKLTDPFDLVLLRVKAYDLEDAMTSFARAVGPETAIVPLLNGMRHLEILDERFGQPRVLGGQVRDRRAVSNFAVRFVDD